MDRELAGAVYQRWERGLPVTEASFYKAATVLGVDADAALTEARFLTAFDKYASENRPMTPFERVYFSLACGDDPSVLEKVASIYGVDQDEILVRKLAGRRFQPDLEKIALMMPPEVAQETMAQLQEQQAAEGGEGGEEEAAAAEEAMGPQGPMDGAQLQQDPTQRFKPSPTAPDQLPPDAMGNLDALVAEQQGVHGQQAEQNGGMPPSGMPEPQPPPPDSTERIQQVAPGMDPETTQRYADKLTEFEEQMGMPISDPKQMVKFVQAMQKVDAKYMDEGIKQFAQQKEQEAGIGQTVPGQGPTVPGFEGGAAGAGGGAGGAAGPGGQAGGPPAGGKPKIAPGQPLPAAAAAKGKGGGAQPQEDPNSAIAKVAAAGRILAQRSHARA